MSPLSGELEYKLHNNHVSLVGHKTGIRTARFTELQMSGIVSHYRQTSLHAEVARDFRLLSGLASRDADAAEDTYLNLQPHIEKPGNVYVFLQQNEGLIGLLPNHQPGTAVDCVDLKVGKAEVVEARWQGHQAQCKGVQRIWAYRYTTNKPKLIDVERLVHIRLRAMNARQLLISCTKCAKRHCKFYGKDAAGGLEGVASLIEARLIKIREVPIRIPLYYPS
ncbi:hypothetical protein B0H17DRAFT_1152973 [Mycena rosella]|uniref:Bacteriophage T5 Orf172 DNA-binding domain-containing protein n=1 Tax=Mycena rosella TaxID=1033263 RepID=A0AAD7B9Z0_MYCRO|nr:hypothetical protein B0H17DRAFT_1152973 [Mycena rosella]